MCMHRTTQPLQLPHRGPDTCVVAFSSTEHGVGFKGCIWLLLANCTDTTLPGMQSNNSMCMDLFLLDGFAVSRLPMNDDQNWLL